VGRPDAVVVGAGIVGAACAAALAEAGLRVLVLEGGFAGCGTTAAGMGHVVVLDDSAMQLALTSRSRELWAERELPADCEDEATGTLWVAEDEQELALARQRGELLASHGVRAELLDPSALAQAEPGLRPGLAGALLVPDDRVLYPPAAARHLLEVARRLGGVQQTARVTSVAPGRVLVEAGAIETGLVVVAAGLDTPRLLPGAPIVPRRGHLVISERRPGLLHHQLVELGYLQSAHGTSAESVAFNVQPRPTGQVLIGSSREFVGMSSAVNRPLLARMLQRAFDYLPGLAAVPAVRTWVGFRPATPDKLPLIGAWDDRLLVAVGHEGLGVTTATGTAELIADLAVGRPPTLDPAAFDPHRAAAGHA
jgi:glycine/D-amino acid oxidase-like deaminating enzyme